MTTQQLNNLKILASALPLHIKQKRLPILDANKTIENFIYLVEQVQKGPEGKQVNVDIVQT